MHVAWRSSLISGSTCLPTHSPARHCAARSPHPPYNVQHVTSIARAASKQVVLTEDNAADHIQGQQQLAALTGGSRATQVVPLPDGVINTVYGVHGPGWSLLLKQAMPWVRVVGPSFPLSQERLAVEAAALTWLQQLCPAHTPQLLLYDLQNSALAMSWVPAPHLKLVETIQRGQVLPELGGMLSSLLGDYLLHTCAAATGPVAHADALERFRNADIVAVNKAVVLVDPFTPGHPTNRWDPSLEAAAQALWHDPAAMAEVAALQQLYSSCKEVLLHNDLHSGNLLVAPGSLFLIDWEFATMGPAAYDLGLLMGTLIQAAISLRFLPPPVGPGVPAGSAEGGAGATTTSSTSTTTSSSSSSSSSSRNSREGEVGVAPPAATRELQGVRQAQKAWLLQVLEEVWDSVSQQHTAFRATQQGSQGPPTSFDHPQQLLADSIGYAACCLMRQTVGMHHYAPVEALEDPVQRAACQAAHLAAGHRLLLERGRLGSIRRVVALVEECC